MSTLLEEASLVMIPSGYKEDVVYSQIPTDGSGDLTFTRASNGTRVNSAGLVEVVPWNLLEQSSNFNVSPWNNTNVTLTSGQTDPNGGTNAFRAQYSGVSILYQYFSPFNGTNSIYAKAYSSTAKVRICDPNGQFATQYNLTTEWQRITTSGSALLGISIDSFVDGGWTSQDIVIAFAQANIGSTAKPYFPTTDRLNVPRLTYQNGGGGCPSLLLEKQSTNLVTYSEQFDNGAWVQYQGGTITANTITSPDGTQNADTLTVASGQIYSGLYQSVSGSSDVYTVSIFAKYNTKRWLFIFDASASGQGWFDLQNGVVGTIPSGHTGTIENFGNGWYRCTFKKNIAVTPAFFQIGLVDANGQSAPTSNGSSYIWGAQLEASSYATSYIPTTSSSATRVADVIADQTTTIAQAFTDNTKGTIFFDLKNIQLGTGTKAKFKFGNSSSSLQFALYLSSTGLGVYAYQGSGFVIDVSATINQKLAIRFDGTTITGFSQGVKRNTITAGSSFNIDQMKENDTEIASFGISQFVLFNAVLTDAECQALTTI